MRLSFLTESRAEALNLSIADTSIALTSSYRESSLAHRRKQHHRFAPEEQGETQSRHHRGFRVGRHGGRQRNAGDRMLCGMHGNFTPIDVHNTLITFGPPTLFLRQEVRLRRCLLGLPLLIRRSDRAAMSTVQADQPPKTVFLFSGHMIDAPGRKTTRFPPDKEPVAATAIADTLAEIGVAQGDLAICGGACGGD